MTNEQLYFAIGIPILFNALGFTMVILWMNAKFEILKSELKRVEEVMDARVKHQEEQ